VFTYGTNARADFVVRMLPASGEAQSRFEVAAQGEVLGPFELHVPGQHNVLNATAAVAVATRLEIKPEAIAEGLNHFRGVDRRFDVKGCIRGVTVVDDYGHHPTEIRATLRAAKDCGYRRVHVIFQPHRYTRTRDLMADFAASFGDASTVEILDIYAASEEPIEGVSADALVRAVGSDGSSALVEYAASTEEAVERVVSRAEEGDVILTQGAGSVSGIAPLVLAALG
jgi:UDP-N-acetylmuramate--alanine ligase